MKNKGQAVGYVAMFVTFTIGALLLANLFIPQTQPLSTLSTTSESLIKVNASANETFTLTHDEISSFSIAGLTLTTNYSISDAETGVIILNDDTLNDTYLASYSYEPDGYSDDAGTRAIAALLGLAAIVGLLYFVFRSFGLA